MGDAGKKLAQLVLRCRPPYAICVQGKWGAGKTSLMRYAMAKLGGKPLGTTLRTAEKPTIELAESLRRDWDDMAKGADAFVFHTLKEQLDKDHRGEVFQEEVRVSSDLVQPLAAPGRRPAARRAPPRAARAAHLQPAPGGRDEEARASQPRSGAAHPGRADRLGVEAPRRPGAQDGRRAREDPAGRRGVRGAELRHPQRRAALQPALRAGRRAPARRERRGRRGRPALVRHRRARGPRQAARDLHRRPRIAAPTRRSSRSSSRSSSTCRRATASSSWAWTCPRRSARS